MICRVSAFWTSATQSWFGVRDVDRIKGQLIDAMRCRRTRALTGGPRRCLLLLSLSAISPYRAYYKATGHSSVTRRLSCDQGAPFRINEHNKHLWFHGFVLVTLKTICDSDSVITAVDSCLLFVPVLYLFQHFYGSYGIFDVEMC